MESAKSASSPKASPKSSSSSAASGFGARAAGVAGPRASAPVAEEASPSLPRSRRRHRLRGASAALPARGLVPASGPAAGAASRSPPCARPRPRPSAAPTPWRADHRLRARAVRRAAASSSDHGMRAVVGRRFWRDCAAFVFIQQCSSSPRADGRCSGSLLKQAARELSSEKSPPRGPRARRPRLALGPKSAGLATPPGSSTLGPSDCRAWRPRRSASRRPGMASHCVATARRTSP
jgi:hypothetical protein